MSERTPRPVRTEALRRAQPADAPAGCSCGDPNSGPERRLQPVSGPGMAAGARLQPRGRARRAVSRRVGPSSTRPAVAPQRWIGEAGTESSVNTGIDDVTGAGSTADGMVTPAAARRASVSTDETGSPTVA
jgi:hypothetical protein